MNTTHERKATALITVALTVSAAQRRSHLRGKLPDSLSTAVIPLDKSALAGSR